MLKMKVVYRCHDTGVKKAAISFIIFICMYVY